MRKKRQSQTNTEKQIEIDGKIEREKELYSTWNSTQLCGSLAGRGVWGRMDTCICTAESLAVHLKLSQHY